MANNNTKIIKQFGESLRNLFAIKMSKAIEASNNKKDAKVARNNFNKQGTADFEEMCKDPILLRCIELSIVTSIKHGYHIKCDNDRVKKQIENYVDYELGFDEYSTDVLNALLGVNNNIAILTNKGEVPLLRLQHDKSDKSFMEDNLKALADNKYKNLRYYYSTNVFSTKLGLSPLEFVKELLAEKLYLQRFNQAYAKANGKLNQIITFNKDFAAAYLGNSDPVIRDEMSKIIEELTNDTVDKLENLIVPIPLDIVNFQDSNRDMQFIERIRQINYSICSAYGVPPSLVGFDESTDPNLANGENQKDTFISISIDKYKNLIEKVFTFILSSTLGISERNFKFKVGREVNDEDLEKSNQLIKAIEKIGGTVQSLGYDIEIDEQLLANIGMKITKSSRPIIIAEDEPKENE